MVNTGVSVHEVPTGCTGGDRRLVPAIAFADDLPVGRGIESDLDQCVPSTLCPRAVDTGVVSRPAPPVLTIWHNGSESTFLPGHDVVIGRDLRAHLPDRRPTIFSRPSDPALRTRQVGCHRQRFRERHLCQRLSTSRDRHPRRAEHQDRQRGRTPAHVRDRIASRQKRTARTDRTSARATDHDVVVPGQTRQAAGSAPATTARSSTRHCWLLDMGMLAGLTLFYGCFGRWKIRLRR